MTPHQKMMSLDAEGKAYTVSILPLNHNRINEAAVISHSEQWVEIKHRDRVLYPEPIFFNLNLAIWFTVEAL